MPFKPMTVGRRTTRVMQRVAGALGMQRTSDLMYVRLLVGFLTRKKPAALYDQVRALTGDGDIAEVGSWKGKSTVAMAYALRASGQSRTVYAIDHHGGSEEHAEIIATEGSTWDAFLQTIGDAGVKDVIEPLKMNSLDGARWLTEKGVRLRFLFLDGAHDEHSVTEDIEAFLPLMEPGAFIAFDDARPEGGFPGVYKAYKKVLGERSREVAWGGAVLVVQLSSTPEPS